MQSNLSLTIFSIKVLGTKQNKVVLFMLLRNIKKSIFFVHQNWCYYPLLFKKKKKKKELGSQDNHNSRFLFCNVSLQLTSARMELFKKKKKQCPVMWLEEKDFSN